MISKNLYINIIVRILFIVLLSALLGYLIVKDQSFRYSLICLISIIVLTVNLISYLNTVNKKIRFFFDSVRNDDSSLSFSVDEKNPTVKAIYLSMNRVNEQIQRLKIENRNQEQYFQIMLEHLGAGIITFDNKGHILHSNSSARRLLSIDVLTHLSQIERIDNKLFLTIRSIKPAEKRLIAITTENGETELSLKATSFKSKENDLIILSIQDIKSELDEKEIEAWMKLIRVLMHEIMNSITPITSLSESLSEIYSKGGEPIAPEKITGKTIETTLQGLNVIKEQGKGLMSFVESYRKLTRLPEPVKKQFRTADLLDRVKVLYDSLGISEGIDITFSLSDPELTIIADQNLISQVLINLIKNAVEAGRDQHGIKIIVSAYKDGLQNAEICVADNGPGIEKEYLDKIFVPFFTTRENGSGIGLSISRQIMRAHGGNLKVRSVPGRETVFCLSF